MWLTAREWWAVLHGMCLGAIFLLLFSGGLVMLWNLRSETLTAEGIKKSVRHLIIVLWTMAIVAWLTVIIGTYIVYPWYRANPPAATSAQAQKTDLTNYPKAYLLANSKTAQWHLFGMEWKEHIGWLCPILCTVAAFLVSCYREQLAYDKMLRWSLMTIFALSFATAGVAGLFGAFITKAAPLH